MNSKWITAAAVAISSVVVSGVASAAEKDEAQDQSKSSQELAPVKHAVELTVSTGYNQGFGDVGNNQLKLTDSGTAGGALQLGVGYRIIPRLTLGVYGSGAVYGRADGVDSSANIYSATSGVRADWHFIPGHSTWDPWVSAGTGWRGYWSHADQGTTSMHGWEIANLQVGVDYRIDKAVAISPVVGVDLTSFFTQATPTSGGYHNIDNPTVNAFVFAGLQGRFDIPTGSDSSQVASR